MNNIDEKDHFKLLESSEQSKSIKFSLRYYRLDIPTLLDQIRHCHTELLVITHIWKTKAFE